MTLASATITNPVVSTTAVASSSPDPTKSATLTFASPVIPIIPIVPFSTVEVGVTLASPTMLVNVPSCVVATNEAVIVILASLLIVGGLIENVATCVCSSTPVLRAMDILPITPLA